MSASNEKKSRKEQSAGLTEKQRRERQEAKNVKAYTVTFVAILLVIVLVTVGTLGYRAVNQSGVFDRNTVAATVGEHKLNSVTMAYYYGDAIQNAYYQWYNDYGDYINTYTQWLLKLDLTKPLNKQVYDAEKGTTWADNFVSIAMDNAKSDYALYDKAVAEGFQLPEEDAANLEVSLSNIATIASAYGYSSANKYLAATYGFGSTLKSYRQYREVSALASAYYAAHQDSLTYDDAAIRAYDKEHHDEYSSYTGAYYYLSSSSFLEGGTENEDGTTDYTDAQREAARAAAKETAEELVKATDRESLDNLIAGLSINADNSSAASTKYDNTLYSGIVTGLQDWFKDASRKEGDIAVVENTSTTTDEDGTESEVVNGYYVALYEGKNENDMLSASVRHILVNFEGGTKDDDGNTVYSDEEKKAAKDAATKLMETWKSGEATEDSFVAMVKDNTDDSGSAETGGLYEDIVPNNMYEKNFQDWALDETRKPGDVGVVETAYGYHFMYFVGNGLSYRDLMITADLRTNDQETWYNGIVDPVTLTPGSTSRLRMGTVISGG